MPEMDGFEVCYTLKNELRTIHSVILLTARADVDSKLTGLRQGADAYLSKPFDETELRIRIENLINIRRELQDRYTQGSDPATPPSGEAVKQEDAFIAKGRKVINDRIDDPTLDVKALCSEVNLSRTPLHQKLKALTGMSTTEFIRHVRLRRASELLLDPQYNITEVARATGFNNLNWFSRKFKEEFGCTPTEWRKKHWDKL